MDQAQLGVSREYLVKGMDERIVKAYYRYMVDIAEMFGAKREIAKEDLRKSLEFEMKLAKVSVYWF